jgi:uncharacterized membrane protein
MTNTHVINGIVKDKMGTEFIYGVIGEMHAETVEVGVHWLLVLLGC